MLSVPVRIGVAVALAAPARDSRLALHSGIATWAAFGLVTEVAVHADIRLTPAVQKPFCATEEVVT
jgi:hypothetical protein